MLIGIVLSIPFLVFSVYTVLTVYIDENGFMSPSSAFIKIHSNRNSRNVPALTMEDVLNESSAVMKEKPDIVLKIPGIFNKAFDLDKARPQHLDSDKIQSKNLEVEKAKTLNLYVDKVVNQLMKGVEEILKNDTTGSLVPDLFIPLLLTNITVNDTSSNDETNVALNDTQNSALPDNDSTNVTTSKPKLEENSTVTTSTTPLVGLNSTVTTPLVDNSSTATTPKTPLVIVNSTVTTATELNSTMTSSNITPEVLNSTATTLLVEQISKVTTPKSSTTTLKQTKVREIFTTTESVTIGSSERTTAVPNSDKNQSRVTKVMNYIRNIITYPFRKIFDFLKYVRSKVTGRKENIDAEFLGRHEVLFQRLEQIRPKSDSSHNHTPSTTELNNFTFVGLDDRNTSNTSNNHTRSTTETNKFTFVGFDDRDPPNLEKDIEQKDISLLPTSMPSDGIDSPNIFKEKSQTDLPLSPPNKPLVVEDIPNNSKDKVYKEPPQSLPNNPALEVINKFDLYPLNQIKTNGNLSTEDSSRYSYAVPLQATAEEDSGFSLFNILQMPTDYLAGFIGMLYSCALPANTTTTFYSIKDCPTCSSGSQDSALHVSCASSHVPVTHQSIVCHVGGWVVGKAKKPVPMEQMPHCKKYREFRRCPQLTRKPDPKWVGCAQRGHHVDCESPNVTWSSGSELEVLCPPNYRASFDVNTNKEKTSLTQCDSTGQWSRNNVSCAAVCGMLGKQAEGAPLIMHGKKASAGYLPWVTALFLKDGNSLEYICSANIISDRAVATAAHCVYTKEPGELFILAGSTELKKSETSFIKVSQIRIPFSYTDKQGNYGSDIAILLTASPFQFNDVVQPICVDWEDKLDLATQALGKVAGWGVDQNFKEVLSLSYVDLPLVSVENCSREVPVGFKKFFSYTSFCAGYTNGTGVCNGDSGAGFMLERDGQWYLAGTVSISPRQLNTEFCQPKSYALYTKTKLFIPWIKSVLDNPTPSSTTATPNSP